MLHRSPDGLSVLTNSEDKQLRVFNIETDETDECIKLNKVNQIKEGGTIYDYAWYPNTIQKSEDSKLLVYKCNYYKII